MKPLVDGQYLLEKFPGKGGWTYASIPEIQPDKKAPFGWVRVKGFVDDYPLKQYKLMPMGNGTLFLPVKAEIRKKIKKKAGDTVHVILELDDSPYEIPNEIVECFKMEPPELLRRFKSFKEWEQKSYLDWIYQAKREATKTDRILKMMDRVSKNLKFHDKEDERN
jgi:hypothetical protein